MGRLRASHAIAGILVALSPDLLSVLGALWGLFRFLVGLFGAWGRDGKELKRRYENADICLFFKKKSSKSLEV